MADAGEWERLTRLIEDDDAVAAGVREAVEQGTDPWEALLDGLDEAGALAYLQTDDTGMELTDALAQLPRVFAAAPDLDEATDLDDLRLATAAADAVLAASGLRIVRLVEDEGSWPLVVVEGERAPDLLLQAALLGHPAVLGG